MRTDRTLRGATIIEFALVAMLFFLVMWGIFEFARAFYVANTTQYLTRCMARTAVVTLPSQHEAAKKQCLLPLDGTGTSWPFFTLRDDDLTAYFRLRYVVRTVDASGVATIEEVDDTAVTGTNVPDDQVSACVGQNRCVTNVVAYFDASSHPVQMLGLLAAWVGTASSYQSASASTTMPAEAMSRNWAP